MKKFFILLTLAAFMIAAPFAFAADQAGPAKTTADQPGINCCSKGKCGKMGSEADCTKEGGKVVKECKDCK